MSQFAIYLSGSFAAVFLLLVGFRLGKASAGLDIHAVERLGSDLPTLLVDFEKYKRRADEYLGKIEEVINERNVWRDLYNDQAAGHDSAQAMMLSAISALSVAYQRETGKTFRLDPIIDMVRENWVSDHGQQAREERNGQREDSQTKTD